MTIQSIRIDGRVYVSHDCWTFGDYGGGGSVGLANIRVLAAECEGHVMECPMNTLEHISEGCPYGLGSEELAEIRADRPWMIRAYGGYGGEQAWVRKPLAMRLSSHGFRGDTWIEQMDRYPCLSDDEVSSVEMEWEHEAWDSWLRSDLLRTLDDDTQELAEALGNDVLADCYHEAMEQTNTYPEAEYSGVHVDVDRIAKAFSEAVSARLV